jgi:hypothetical protein
MTSSMPMRRRDGVVHEELGHETVVFDERTHKAHVLTAVASFVWLRCDGRPANEVIESLEGELGIEADEIMLGEIISKLGEADLMQKETLAAIPRRALFATALPLALPLVRSVLAPTAALQAASCATLLKPCSSKPCCLGLPCILGVCVLGAAAPNQDDEPNRRRRR